MSVKSILLFAVGLSLSLALHAQHWQKIHTVKDICEAYPAYMQALLDELNLNYAGLEKVKEANEKGDVEKACTELLLFYKNGHTAQFLRREQPAITNKTEALADTVLNNVFVIQNVRGQVPYGVDGHRDWYYKGPNNDWEWAWLSNRHSQISSVLTTYFETGNPKYAEYIDLFLRDFIIKSMPYPGVKSSNSIWRGLEVAARIKIWSRIFYGLLNSEYLSPSTQLLMLASLPEHAHYNRYFHAQNNWLTMEISALATFATNFPEFKNSAEWLDYSIETMTESMRGQVYPDGAQTELTVHYHNVALKNFELLKIICDRANKPMPEFYTNTLKNMYSYTAHVVRPDGCRVLNNDGDCGSDLEFIISGAKMFDQPDWEYIATNGKTGTKPADGPSYFYPWAGHLVSRSDFDKNAHWSFFDVGPWGSGHQHNDKLHISISAFGRDLLVDAGRFAYTGEVAEKFRPYAKGTQGHNSVLIDGKGQMPDVGVVDEPLTEIHYKITSEFDYAWNSFDKYFDIEDVKHTRSMMYVRDEFWIVVDKIDTDKPRKIETLWHWHPRCAVEVENGIVSTKNETGNLKVIPLETKDWQITEIEGQEEPDIQGWYSVEYNKYEPNLATIYSTQIQADESFVWVLLPSEKEAPEVNASILSKNADGVTLEVVSKEKGKWRIEIPYANSAKAKLEFKNE
ncbi:heparinase II/III family protein [Prolixibacteraceae bacterium Z1-6]|uniref:Heparinase II/III family protein n=1 Tax=Draconibacterium aestuarii TaxID=2998507 RepID=A0A9X3J533_9BACT|nr:heparinase II/III family protein [Prolixibacteraceae bacterium Z1-6]